MNKLLTNTKFILTGCLCIALFLPVSGQSRKPVLSIPNDIAISRFFESMHFETYFSPFIMDFNYTEHAIDWWQRAHNDTLPLTIVSDLSRYRGQASHKFAKAYIDADYKIALRYLSPFPDSINSKSSFIVLPNATVDANGVVISSSSVLLPRSCLHCQRSEFLRKTCVNPPNPTQRHITQHNLIRCVTIAQYWGGEYYHFIAENLPRLMPVISIMNTENLAIHVHRKNTFVTQLLQLLNLSSLHLIKGSVFATKLLVPESISCGNTPAYFLHEMQAKFLATILTENDKKIQPECRILVIKRKTRAIINHAELVNELRRNFLQCHVAEHLGYEPVAEQLKMMSDASVLIAPHGAGLVNMFLCRRNTLILEFLNRKGDAHILYMVMAMKLGLRYIGVPVLGLGQKYTNKFINVTHSVRILQRYL